MNLTILRALFEDARQQVLDNKVFRLLILLTALPILGTFLVGFREDHISFLWGYQVIEYERPKMIQGRFLGQKQAPIQEVGVQWTGHYYAGRSKVTPTSPPMMYQGAQSEHGMHAPPGMAYDDAAGYNTEMYGPSGGNYATNPGPYAYGADPAALV